MFYNKVIIVYVYNLKLNIKDAFQTWLEGKIKKVGD